LFNAFCIRHVGIQIQGIGVKKKGKKEQKEAQG